jgi:ribonuclease BN (tRNA processing enzyme)
LVTHGDTRVLLDCGNGSSIRLGHELGGAPLSAVVVSHFHLDTVSDLFPVAAALTSGTPIFLPEGARPKVHRLMRAYGIDRATRERTLLEGVSRISVKDVGSMRLTFERSAHGCPGVAVRIASPGGVLVYLSDTGPRPWLAEFARGADLLIAHTLILDGVQGRITRHNLTAGAAGRLAREAGVRRLALSHIPFYAAAEASHAEAKGEFGGETLVLREGQRLPVR